jgi:hypothetical protein
MRLGNMRQNGVRVLFVTCCACGYHAEVNVDSWPHDIPVRSLGSAHGVQVRPSRRFSEIGIRSSGGITCRAESDGR